LGNILGTSFATAGFSYDPNISPNNQSFSAAVRAVALKNATAIVTAGTGTGGGASFSGTYTQPITLGTGTDAVDAALTINGPLHADALDIVTQAGNYSVHIVTENGATQAIADIAVVRVPGSTANHYLEGPNIELFDSTLSRGMDMQFSGGQIEFWFSAPAQALVLNTATPMIVPNNNGVTVFQVNGTAGPTVQGYGPNAAALVDMTPDSGTFTGTFGGLTSAVTGVAYWSRQGNHVTLQLPAGTGSSNATTFSFAPLPVEIQPPRIQNLVCPGLTNNGVSAIGGLQINTATINFFVGNFSAFTASGAKAFGLGNNGSWPISYPLTP
jgi:hypothetical protein